MKWYNSNEFAPEHSSQIFIWDAQDQKQIYFHWLGEWDFNATYHHNIFPIWRYVHEGIAAIPRNPFPSESIFFRPQSRRSNV